MRTHFTQWEQQKNGRHGLYDLDPSHINYCNEGLYNLPSVLQLHIFSNAKDVTWGGWIGCSRYVKLRNMRQGTTNEQHFFLSQTLTFKWQIREITVIHQLAFWIDRGKKQTKSIVRGRQISDVFSCIFTSYYWGMRRGSKSRQRSDLSCSLVTPCVSVRRDSCDDCFHMNHVSVLCHNIFLTSLEW